MEIKKVYLVIGYHPKKWWSIPIGLKETFRVVVEDRQTMEALIEYHTERDEDVQFKYCVVEAIENIDVFLDLISEN